MSNSDISQEILFQLMFILFQEMFYGFEFT